MHKMPGLDYSGIMKLEERYKRSTISAKEGKDKVEFLIKADDAVALRASMNAVMRSVEIIEKTYKTRLPR